MFGIRFSPAALIGFEVMLAEKAETMVDDIAKKISSSEGAVHADETYWALNGDRAYFWVHGDEKCIHFQFDTTRAGEVSRNTLGRHFTGTLVTDCYSGYAAHTTDKKQKCLAHLARTARDWQKLTKQGALDFAFFNDVRVPPTNNLAERALRPLVVLRKVTFGHRSVEGGRRMAKLISVAETARRHGHRPSDIYFELLTRPPDIALQRLYAGAK